MSQPYSTVIFDFDYTLADSSRGAVECANFALKELGFPAASEHAICRTMGMPLDATFAYLTRRDDPAEGREFFRLFVKRADEVMAELTTIYESLPSVVRRLRERNLQLAIVSGKFRYRMEEILRRESLLASFDLLIGLEDVARHKPDPEGLRKAMDRLGSSPAQALYVGDSVVDAETAQRAGVAFAAVLSGVTLREEFGPYPAVRIVEDLQELADWITT